METILNIISGGIGGAILVWLFRNWISERLKQSIQHEYSQKLENHKAELNSKVQSVLYEQQLHQLRTSLFFDHQRVAFASILSQLAKTRSKWWEIAGNPEEPFMEPVPLEEYKEFEKLFYEHQLFFDSDCLLAIGLAIKAMTDSLPVYGFDGPPQQRECREPYERLEYVQDRMAQIFQEKIGVASAHQAKYEIALLSLIKFLNSYHFAEIGLPVTGALKLSYRDEAPEAVTKAKQNIGELITKAKEFTEYLSREGYFHEASTMADRCLAILENDQLKLLSNQVAPPDRSPRCCSE
ncbi:MAG: hypothetical protein GX151_08610 [Gammaproteobacteria bacterium]|jgi:hypothetical protein|nr:hypothetical protein [Gammaproteobacteria bacterium]